MVVVGVGACDGDGSSGDSEASGNEIGSYVAGGVSCGGSGAVPPLSALVDRVVT